MTEAVEEKIDPVVGALNVIIEELRRQRAQEEDLWGPEEIGAYMKVGKGSVWNKVLNTPGFPTAVVLPTGGRRWVAKEIKAWVLKRRRG